MAAVRRPKCLFIEHNLVGRSVWVLSAGKISKFDVASKDGDEFDLAAAYDELGGGTEAPKAATAHTVSTSRINSGPTTGFGNSAVLGTRVALEEEEDDQQQQDTFDDYFADFQEMFSIGESHYSVAAGFISKKVHTYKMVFFRSFLL